MSAVAWWGYSIASAAIVLILGSMYLLIRIMSDDSGKYEEFKKMLDPIFHPPAFLRPGADNADNADDADDAAATRENAATSVPEPFEEECPGCGERVTEQHAACPACGLRLL